MVLLFIGPSGSGKDTQAQMLAMQSSFQNISTGDFIRDISNGATGIQTYIKKAMGDGFVNDELVYGLLQIFIKYARGDDFILNGAIRFESQIEVLDRVLEKIDQKVDHVFLFKADDEILIDRLMNRLYCQVCKSNYNTKTNPSKFPGKCDRCGSALFAREDDNMDSIKSRLADYKRDNEKIISTYSERGILTEIDATKPIAEMFIQLKTHVEKLSM